MEIKFILQKIKDFLKVEQIHLYYSKDYWLNIFNEAKPVLVFSKYKNENEEISKQVQNKEIKAVFYKPIQNRGDFYFYTINEEKIENIERVSCPLTSVESFNKVMLLKSLFINTPLIEFDNLTKVERLMNLKVPNKELPNTNKKLKNVPFYILGKHVLLMLNQHIIEILQHVNKKEKIEGFFITDLTDFNPPQDFGINALLYKKCKIGTLLVSEKNKQLDIHPVYEIDVYIDGENKEISYGTMLYKRGGEQNQEKIGEMNFDFSYDLNFDINRETLEVLYESLRTFKRQYDKNNEEYNEFNKCLIFSKNDESVNRYVMLQNIYALDDVTLTEDIATAVSNLIKESKKK